jgi:two-component system OmpR family sensor kinase
MKSAEERPGEAAQSFKDRLEELRLRNVELTEALAARDDFIALTAHELRNPMTPMLGQVDLLLKWIPAGRCSPEQVEQGLRRLRHIISQYIRRTTVLLDVSRITSGKLRLEPEPCDLAKIVRDVAKNFAEAALYAGSPISIDLPGSVPGTWDRLALEQITDNLVSNAIKYGAGQPIEVCVENLDGQVRLRVRDYGPGIALEYRSRIFERFERAVRSDKQQDGFGVGLWVVNQLVNAMEGAITVDDAEGGGSVFSVTLPRHLGAKRL